MAGTVISLKSALAHLEQATNNAKGPIATAKRIVQGVGRLVIEITGQDSTVGREVIGCLTEAIQDLDHAVAMMEVAAHKVRQGIGRVGNV